MKDMKNLDMTVYFRNFSTAVLHGRRAGRFGICFLFECRHINQPAVAVVSTLTGFRQEIKR